MGKTKQNFTQKELILKHLQAGQTLSPMEALKKFGCYRLSHIIYVLRKEGYQIDKSIASTENKLGGISRYAVYFQKKEDIDHDKARSL